MTDHEEISLLSCFVTKYKEGERQVDVFDLIYETSKPYDEVKRSLDGLCGEGQVRQLDLRTYELACDAYELEKQLVKSAAGIDTRAPRIAEKMKHLRERQGSGDGDYSDFFSSDSIFDDDDEDYDDEDDDDNDDILCYYYEDEDLKELRENLDKIAEEEKKNRLWSFGTLVRSMNGRISSGLQETLDRACQIVYHFKLKYATPEILVFAMMLSHCTACNVMAYVGINFAAFSQRAVESVDPNQSVHGFTIAAQMYLRRLLGVVRSDVQHKREISTEHLLSEIISHDNLTTQIINDLGVDLDELKEMLKAIVED